MQVPEILITCWQEIEIRLMESPSSLLATSALMSEIAWERIRGKLGCINGIKLPQVSVSVVLCTEHKVRGFFTALNWSILYGTTVCEGQETLTS